MMKQRSTYMQSPKGIWEKDGIKLPNVARIKADKCFCSPGVRKMIPSPNKLVQYDLASLKKDENNFSEEVYSEKSNFSGDMYTIEVTEIGNPKTSPVAVCLSLIDFCKSQKNKLKRLYHIPDRVFQKDEIARHVESHIPINIDEEILDILGSDQVLARGHLVPLGESRVFVHY